MKLTISTSISPRQLREYYRENMNEFTQDGSVTFRQLLVPVNDQDQQKIIKQVDADLAANKNFEEPEAALQWTPLRSGRSLPAQAESAGGPLPSGSRGGQWPRSG